MSDERFVRRGDRAEVVPSAYPCQRGDIRVDLDETRVRHCGGGDTLIASVAGMKAGGTV